MQFVCVCVGYLFVHVVWLGLRTRICPMHLLYGMHKVQNTHLQNRELKMHQHEWHA